MCEHVFVSASTPVATILHADLDAFYASVEQRDDPRLRGRPVIVGGGVVMAASYEARAFGVRGAMGGRQARQLCPHAIVVAAPHVGVHRGEPGGVRGVPIDTTPLVEGISIDEAFLDVGGLRRVSGTPEEIAAQLRRDVLDRVGLAHHRRRRPHEVPGQGRVAGGQARRPARRAARRRARVPAPAPGRPSVGRRARHRPQAPRARHPHGW